MTMWGAFSLLIALAPMSTPASKTSAPGESDLMADASAIQAAPVRPPYAGVLSHVWRRPLIRTGFFRSVTASFGAPAVSERQQRVIVGTADGMVLALSLKDGHELWRYRYTAPFETDATIVKGAEDHEWALLSSRDGHLLALDIASGALVWNSQVEGEVRAPPVVDGEHLVVMTMQNKVMLLDLLTGASIWSKGRPKSPGLTVVGHAQPLVAGQLVYAAFSDGNIAALNREDGSLVWSVPLSLGGGEFVDSDATPVLLGDTLYAASFSDGIYALDPLTGKILWKVRASGVTQLAVSDTTVVAASAQGLAWGLSPSDGAVLFCTRFNPGPISRIYIRENKLLFSAGTTGLVVLDARTGKPLQATAFAREQVGDLGIAGDDVALISTTGYLYAMKFRQKGS